MCLFIFYYYIKLGIDLKKMYIIYYKYVIFELAFKIYISYLGLCWITFSSTEWFKLNKYRENLVGNYYITVFSLILLLPFYFPFTDLVHPTLSVLSIIIEGTSQKKWPR
jgi:hypothetical protein